jgi:hypothetical protein
VNFETPVQISLPAVVLTFDVLFAVASSKMLFTARRLAHPETSPRIEIE